MNIEKEFHGPNAGYILDLYEQYLRDTQAVDESARQFFATWKPEKEKESQTYAADLKILAGAANLIQAIRAYGYLAADLNPLEKPAPIAPLLTFAFHGVQETDLQQLPADIANLRDGKNARNALAAVKALREIYSGTIGYDYAHVRNPEEREWLYETAESGRYRGTDLTANHELLKRLTQVEAFEIFLQRFFPGKTRFSIEGLDMLVPMLDEVVRAAAKDKICALLIGTAHRGRLNILAHILNKPYEQIFAEFVDPQGRGSTWDVLGWTGDVKYHKSGTRKPGEEVDMVIHMPANPSHLEQIDPVLLGMARAANTGVDAPGAPAYYPLASLPVLIHGDSAFSGQGIVAETLNLSQLKGYTTSGCLHIIANNQLGFTTDKEDVRGSLHASDLAKAFEFPVVHVNADDPRACLEAVRTAFAYRQKFQKDFVINLIGYRRYGHNEGDEPRFTQPVMYRKIDKHPSVRSLWAKRLEGDDLLKDEEAEKMLEERLKMLQEINQQLNADTAIEDPRPTIPPVGAAKRVKTAVTLQRLTDLNQALLEIPEGFQLNTKLVKALERRQKLFSEPDTDQIDWATAEELAFASILEDGISIRLTGQDSERGTFSQRHAVFTDTATNERFIPLQSISQARAAFEIHNSPLSEAGVLGFEFGYNVQSPERMVIWEAQYGDFINNAQTVVDEYLLSARAKWGMTPSMVLLLPHGNEGMGPNHSSGRIERFLNLAAETNVRIAMPSSAAQYFHLLRRQALLLKTDPLPLIVFTPKGLLRHPLVSSKSGQFSDGGWQPVIADSRYAGADQDGVRSLILCSGRIFVDLYGSELYQACDQIAIARLEQLYPLPLESIKELLARYRNLEQVIWVQEEPYNMGAWGYIRPQLREILQGKYALRYVGRPESSSPAEGSSTIYRLNQQTLIEQAFRFQESTPSSSVMKEAG